MTMKNFKNKLISQFPDKDSHEIEIYNNYLHKRHFRGFYYDSEDKSYGIVLSFSQKGQNSMNLFAQESQAGNVLVEYRINCASFTMEQLAYDKVMISASAHKQHMLVPNDGILQVPQVVQFTLQILTRSSIYLKFINHEQFTRPISSFQGGLVLSLDMQPVHENSQKIRVEANKLF